MIDSGNNMVMPVSPYGGNGGFGDMGGGGLRQTTNMSRNRFVTR